MATGLPSGSEDLPLLQKGWELVRSLPERQEEDESEWEEDEVSYLVLDTESKLRGPEIASLEELQISGLTTSNPFVRLGPNTFEGRYENLLGTEMILEEHTSEDGKLSLQPWALTASHLRLNPVVLTEKQFEDIDNTAALQVDLGDLVPTKKRGRPKKLRAPDLTGEDVEPAPKAARTGRGRGRGSRGGRGSPSGRGGRGFGGADPSTDASEALPPMTAAPAAAQPDQVEDFGELTFSNDPSHEADDATASQNVQDPGTVHNTT